MESKACNAEEVCLPVPKHCRAKGRYKNTKFNKIEFKLKCASLAADESNKSRNATVQETRKVCRKQLHSLFAVVARDLGGVYMTPGRLSPRSEFTPVPSHGSIFVYMIPAQNVMPARVTPV